MKWIRENVRRIFTSRSTRQKRVLCALIALSLIMPCLPQIALAQEESSLILNGSFEDGEENGSASYWDFRKTDGTQGQIERRTSGGKKGAYLFMEPEDGAVLAQNSGDAFAAVNGGKTYELTYYGYSAGKLSVEIEEYDAAGNSIAHTMDLTEYTIIDTAEWTKKSICFTTEEDAASVLIRYTAMGGESGVDEVELKERDALKANVKALRSGIASVSPNLLSNGNFSNDITGWQTSTGLPYSFVSDSDYGTVLKVAGSNGSFWTTESIDIEEETDYTLSYYVKIEGSGKCYVNLQQAAGSATALSLNGNSGAPDTIIRNTNNAWKRVNVTFNSDMIKNGRAIHYMDMIMESSGTYYFADFKIAKKVKTVSSNLISNGDFEDDITGWQTSTGLPYSFVSDSEHGNVLKVSNANGSFWTTESFDIKAGKNYTLSYYVKIDGTGKCYVNLQQAAGSATALSLNGNGGAPDTIVRNTNNTWKKVSVTFNSDMVKNGRAIHYLDMILETAGTYYFADFRIEEAAEEEPIEDDGYIKNGSFKVVRDQVAANWSVVNAGSTGSTVEFIAEEEGYQDKGYAKVVNNCLDRSPTYVGIRTSVNVEPDTRYVLQFYILPDGEAVDRSKIQFQQYKVDGSKVAANDLQYMLSLEDNGQWQLVEIAFVTDAEASSINVNYFLMYPFETAGATALLDRFGMRKIELEGGNFDFEASDTTPHFWAMDGTTSGGKIGIEKGGSYNGSNALKLTTGESESSQTGAASEAFEVKPNTAYEITYWGKLVGSTTANGWVQPYQTKADGSYAGSTYSATGENFQKSTPWISWNWQWRMIGNTDWQKIKVSFITGSEAANLKIDFFANGSNSIMFVDDVTITEIPSPANAKELNEYLDFEKTDVEGNLAGWYVSSARCNVSEIQRDDTVYHSGKSSAYVKKDGLSTYYAIESPYRFAIKPGMTYEFSFWVASRNTTPNTTIRMNLVYYDANGNRMWNAGGSQQIMNGTIQNLNYGTERSEWRQVMTRATLSSAASYASVQFIMTQGVAELWLDDIFADVVEDGTDIVAAHNDFHAVDQDGNIEGWKLASDSGSAAFDVEDGAGRLVNTSGTNYMKYTTPVLETQYQYVLTGRYRSSVNATAEMKFYDYARKEVEYTASPTTLPASSSWNEFRISFTAPSNTYASLLAGLTEAGSLLLDDIVIYQVGQPVTAGNWKASWVWYNEDAMKECNYDSRFFRYHIYLDDEAEYAPIQCTADDRFAFYINGEKIFDNIDSGAANWANIQVLDLTQYLKKGDNVIAIKAYNLLSQAAILFDGIWTLKNGTEVIAVSDDSVKTIKRISDDRWTETDYNDSRWEKVAVIGKPPVSPWGAVFYDSTIYNENGIEIIKMDGDGKKVDNGVFEFSLTMKLKEKLTSNFPLNVNIWQRNSINQVSKASLKLMDHTDMSQWPVDEEFTVKLRMEVPIYLESGKYTLQLEDKYISILNEDIYDAKFINFDLEQEVSKEAVKAEIKKVNGAPTLVVNGELTPFYAYSRPDYNYCTWDYEAAMAQSGIELYTVRQGALGKQSLDYCWPAEGVADYDAFDDPIYETLANNSNAYLIVQVGMYAPDWWMEENPDECVLLSKSNGTITQYVESGSVSYGSEKFRKEAGEILKLLMEHMKTQSYYSRVVGIQVTTGKSFENQYWGGQTVEQRPDYGKTAVASFRRWLKEKYGTVGALRSAWNDNTVTFETAEPPTYQECRAVDGNSAFLDVSTQRRVLDHNLYLNDVVTDELLYFGDIVDDVHAGNLVIGCFNGYLFSGAGCQDVGQQHTSFQRLLEDDTYDFFVSPANYSERELGNADTYMGFEDTVQAYGKMAVIEEDHRTVLVMHYANTSWDAANDIGVGGTHTMEDTLDQMKKNVADSIVSGNGMWFFDMKGGWFDDDQFYGFSRECAAEYLFSQYVDKELDSSSVAYFVDDELTPYFTEEYSSLYFPSNIITYAGFRLQRRELNRIGQSYDVYSMASLADGKAKAHKINIVFCAYQITDKEREAIDKYLKKNGQIVVFVYATGLSDGKTDSAANMEAVVEMPLTVEKRRANLNVQVTDDGSAITEGLLGMQYGTQTGMVAANSSPLIYVNTEEDSSIKTLGTLIENGKTGLAVKKMEDWTCVYSSTPNLPATLLRNMIKMQSGHIYSDNKNDVIWANGGYVALHSSTGGTKTIHLTGNYSVYDVFEQKFVSMDTDTITYDHRANDTHLFRLLTPGKLAVLTTVRGGHGKISSTGITEVDPGADFTLTITPDEGYEIKEIIVNGTEAENTDTLKFTDIRENQTVRVSFKKKAVADGKSEETKPSGDQENQGSQGNTDVEAEPGTEEIKSPSTHEERIKHVEEDTVRKMKYFMLPVRAILISIGIAAAVAIIIVVLVKRRRKEKQNG